MGDPKKRRKQFEGPRKAFQKERIEKERDLKKTYGLKNTKELYMAESNVRRKRTNARKLLALSLENRLKREKELVNSLKEAGILSGSPTLEDVLTLTTEALLERRLQTVVLRKGLANTVKQARQFVVHGHVAIDGKRVDRPGYIVSADEESKVSYYGEPMVLEQKKVPVAKKGAVEAKKNEVKEAFEEAKPAEAKEE